MIPLLMEIELKSEEGSEFLSLSEVDAVTSATFESMIKDAFQEGKHFILARIKTR
jgi:hypothetical protein